MSVDQTRLDAAATERKARLAKLASLKRKQPDDGHSNATDSAQEIASNKVTNKYISGRNFDLTTDAPKLGFEQAPNSQQETVEEEASRLAKAAADQAAKEETEGEQIDLFKLQPKKPNWDLKRDLAERTKILDVRTQNAIAKLVRERIQKAKEEANRTKAKTDEGEELGVEGNTLVEAVHLREKEDEEERRRQNEDDEIP